MFCGKTNLNKLETRKQASARALATVYGDIWLDYDDMLQRSGHTDKSYVSGPRLNIKTVLSTYGDFHVKDKTAVRTSYL